MHTPAAPDEAKGDMTSMIDVVFLMIVFFVCIDFKVLEAKLDAFLPFDRGGRSPVEPEQVVSVKVMVAADGREVPHSAGRYSLVGHRVTYDIAGAPLTSEAALRDELRRIADDPSLMVPDRETGGRRRMGCIVEGYPGTRYDDVARAADLCRAAGFDDISFGGGLGPK